MNQDSKEVFIKRSQILKEIRNFLAVNEHIIGIEEFDCDTDGESLFCYFRVITDLGNIEGVNLNV